MATIVQNYGPIYGEVVNGTVQGRPNGSVYVPISNTITLEIPENYRYIKKDGANYLFCSSSGVNASWYNCPKINAQSQDLASNMKLVVYSDAELTTLLGDRSNSAGLFNDWYPNRVFNYASPAPDIVADDTYYAVAYLMNNSTPVATSYVVELTGVVIS